MTKHELVEAAPIMLGRVLDSDFRSLTSKIEFVDFLQGCLDRAANKLDPLTDGDLYRPLADLFGQVHATRLALCEELEEEEL